MPDVRLDPNQVDALCSAIRNIAEGGVTGPSGLESVGMALAGERLSTPVGEAIITLAESINGLADAIRERD